eukprot:TRINITY_DN54136_c0_g1_i1.p1 TRINITY_DN54136_c0_g1~~TRINITY_DN54136_c0_g1_i1.p1  ORF type:complete len:144 (+),score=32.67 TRINITY_DN54136_c0_g1_i1:116-547(+)
MFSAKVCVVALMIGPISAFAGSCGDDDLAKIKAVPADTSAKSFGALSAVCGRKSYSFLTGKFDHATFDSCMKDSIGISGSCSECYADLAEYGCANCKMACLSGWCTSKCLECTAAAQPKAAQCSGYQAPTVKPCSANVVPLVV